MVSHICTYIATECRNRSENLINRKFSIFYIKTIYQLFFQLQQKNIWFRDQKNIYVKKMNEKKIRQFSENRKCWSKKSQIDKIFRFSEKFRIFFFDNFFLHIFFLIPKKSIFWLELEKKLVHSFYVENWELSIYEVFRAIPTLFRDVGANIWHQKFKIPLLYR